MKFKVLISCLVLLLISCIKDKTVAANKSISTVEKMTPVPDPIYVPQGIKKMAENDISGAKEMFKKGCDREELFGCSLYYDMREIEEGTLTLNESKMRLARALCDASPQSEICKEVKE